MPADVHIEGLWVGAQQVIVYGRNLYAALEQLGHDRIDLGLEQHQVAHHHRFAVSRLECSPAAERQRRLDSDAVDRYLQIGSRKAVAVTSPVTAAVFPSAA